MEAGRAFVSVPFEELRGFLQFLCKTGIVGIGRVFCLDNDNGSDTEAFAADLLTVNGDTERIQRLIAIAERIPEPGIGNICGKGKDGITSSLDGRQDTAGALIYGYAIGIEDRKVGEGFSRDIRKGGTDGSVRGSALVGDLVDIGLEMLNPLEIKAGMDPNRLKSLYGDKLAFHGGINAQLWDRPELVLAEMERIIPIMKEGGGYVFASAAHVYYEYTTPDGQHELVFQENQYFFIFGK